MGNIAGKTGKKGGAAMKKKQVEDVVEVEVKETDKKKAKSTKKKKGRK